MIYISGKITGTDDYLYRFERAEKHLNTMNITDVINPANVTSYLPELSYGQYIKMSLCMLEMCDTIYMLKGWENSAGAKLEWGFAKANNYKILYE